MSCKLLSWIKRKPKTVIEILIFLSLALSIFFYIMTWELPGKILLAFFFISFISLLLYDAVAYVIKKIKKRK